MSLWLTTAEADTYMSTRLGSGGYWDSSTEKTAALTTAQADIVSSPRFSITDDTEVVQVMKDAVCEQALFRLQDLGIDARTGLQAQSVTEAGVVAEKYSGADGIAICAKAAGLLKDYDLRQSGGWLATLTRERE